MNLSITMMNLSHFRTMNYIEVIYFEKNIYKERKQAFYQDNLCDQMFLRTENKMKEEKKQTLISLRDENHNLIKSVKTF